MFPLEVASRGIDRLNHVACLWHIQDAVVRQRRAFLASRRECSRPDHAERIHVLPIYLIERAVSPAVERPPPHQPVVR